MEVGAIIYESQYYIRDDHVKPRIALEIQTHIIKSQHYIRNCQEQSRPSLGFQLLIHE